MPSLRLVAIATLALVALAACGGSSSSSGAANPTPVPSGGASSTQAPPTAAPSGVTGSSAPSTGAVVALCTLFTTDDLKTITTADYGAGVLDSVGQCTWRVGGVTANNGDGQIVAALQDATLDAIKATFPGGVDLTVGGHTAYWNPGEGLQSIWTDVGGRTLVLSLDPVTDDSQTVAQKLATVALAKF